MSKLFLSSITMPSGNLGGENPLPQMRAFFNASSAADIEGSQAKPETPYPDHGKESILLPYRLQDQYDHATTPRAHKTAVLENDILRATFLLDLGGRLLSLVHKPSGRELLYVNPLFRPANFGIRDAWFTGGSEWNIGILGHCVFTCSPLFAARVETDQGPMLRLYEFERARRVTFQVDIALPDGSPYLLVYVRIINPHEHKTPMYWWSNIAVPEHPEHRVLSPATSAYRHAYSGTLDSVDVPRYADFDATYVSNTPAASDLYFRIAEDQRPWIASLDKTGRGLIHASTRRMKGRKLWCWGQFQGGRHWQDFLAVPGDAYLEIQGGLTTTQAEYITMPAKTKWSWVEAYGLMEGNPATVHGEWVSAYQHVNGLLDKGLPPGTLEAANERFDALADRKPAEILHQGSGWGALEEKRRKKAGEKPLASEGLPFAESTIGAEQAQWMSLLNEGALPERSVSEEPGSFMVQPEWHRLLEEGLKAGKGDHWLSWYHLGIMRRRAGDRVGAREAWEKSLQRKANGWAYRNLADLLAEDGDLEGASALWISAVKLLPGLLPLVVEAGNGLLSAGKPVTWLALLESVPAAIRSSGRVHLTEITARLELGDIDAPRKFFEANVDNDEIIINVREGEMSLSELWFGWQEKLLELKHRRPLTDEEVFKFRSEAALPRTLDFRLRPDTALPVGAYRPGKRVKEKG